MNFTQLEALRKWNGDVKYLQHFQLKRFKKKDLKNLSVKKDNRMDTIN